MALEWREEDLRVLRIRDEKRLGRKVDKVTLNGFTLWTQTQRLARDRVLESMVDLK